MKNTYDIIFCVLPPMLVDRIYTTPAVLKGIVQSLGFCARCFDFSIDLFNYCGRNPSKFAQANNYYMIANMEQSEEEKTLTQNFYDRIIETITSVETRYIGLTVFSILTHKPIVEVLLRLKELGLSDKVILGGRGLTALTMDTVKEFLPITDEDTQSYFVDVLKKYGLIKHAVVGDGEDAIVEFLVNNENIKPGINNANLDVIHYPDYSDYNFNDFLWADNDPHLLVTGSTGCVRDCDFCDIQHAFGKFKFKQGNILAEEMIYLQKTYGVNRFILTDSLVNGGMKPFTEFMTRLKKHNSTAKNKIRWSGQYICRDELRHKKNIDEYYQLLKDSGANGITPGAESGSNHVLKNMDKKTTVEALFFELEYFRKYGLNCQILTFPGHWSERNEDFVEHCRFLHDLVPYIKSGTITSVYLGTPFKVLPNTPADNNLNLIKHKKDYNIWIARSNRANTYKARLKRKLLVDDLAKKLKMSINDEETEVLQYESEFIRNNLDDINAFFTKHSRDPSGYIENDQKFIDSIFNHKKTFDINLDVDSTVVNSEPILMIKINDQTVFENQLSSGQHSINISVPSESLGKSNVVKFYLTNKNLDDTQVSDSGEILKDKSIVFKKLYINNCDILVDQDFFYSNFYVERTDKTDRPSPGLWSNDPLCLKFENPFVYWYANASERGWTTAHRDIRSVGSLKNEDLYLTKLKEQLNQIII